MPSLEEDHARRERLRSHYPEYVRCMQAYRQADLTVYSAIAREKIFLSVHIASEGEFIERMLLCTSEEEVQKLAEFSAGAQQQ